MKIIIRRKYKNVQITIIRFPQKRELEKMSILTMETNNFIMSNIFGETVAIPYNPNLKRSNELITYKVIRISY